MKDEKDSIITQGLTHNTSETRQRGVAAGGSGGSGGQRGPAWCHDPNSLARQRNALDLHYKALEAGF